MLSQTVFTTQKINVSSSSGKFVLAVPDVFSAASAGDVFSFDLSLEVAAKDPSQKGVLRLSFINSYTQNDFGSSMLLNTAQDPEMRPSFMRFTPVIFTVIQNGVNPLDQGVVHMGIELVSGSVTELDVTVKALWYQVDRVNL